MLGQALCVAFLLLLKAAQGEECPGPGTHRVTGFSGQSFWLRPNCTRDKIVIVQWKFEPPGKGTCSILIYWRNKSDPRYEDYSSPLFDNRLNFSVQDFALHVKEAQQQHSGLYRLELTQNTGAVKEICFQVSILEHVEKPQLQGQAEILDGGMCEVSLNCWVSRTDSVSFAWRRGNEQIQGWRNQTHREQVAANSSLVYTCSVSNTVSWANSTLDLTRDCQKEADFPLILMISTIVPAILLVTLLIATICFCVRKQKMKQSGISQQQILTNYEHVNSVKPRRNQSSEQSPPGEMSTIYSMIQTQSSAPTSQENEKTLYSLVQTSRKSSAPPPRENEKTVYSVVQTSRKKRNRNSSVNCTVYEEVGNRPPRVENPSPLTRKELENFLIYS